MSGVVLGSSDAWWGYDRVIMIWFLLGCFGHAAIIWYEEWFPSIPDLEAAALAGELRFGRSPWWGALTSGIASFALVGLLCYALACAPSMSVLLWIAPLLLIVIALFVGYGSCVPTWRVISRERGVVECYGRLPNSWRPRSWPLTEFESVRVSRREVRQVSHGMPHVSKSYVVYLCRPEQKVNLQEVSNRGKALLIAERVSAFTGLSVEDQSEPPRA